MDNLNLQHTQHTHWNCITYTRLSLHYWDSSVTSLVRYACTVSVSSRSCSSPAGAVSPSITSTWGATGEHCCGQLTMAGRVREMEGWRDEMWSLHDRGVKTAVNASEISLCLPSPWPPGCLDSSIRVQSSKLIMVTHTTDCRGRVNERHMHQRGPAG